MTAMLATGSRSNGLTGGKQVQTRSRRLEALNRAYSNDPAFSHLRYLTPMTHGYGSTAPRLTFVVEAPNINTVNTKPGRYLDGPERVVVVDLLKSIDLSEEHVYFTGLVKYPLPQARGVRPEEMNASMPYLRKELDTIQSQLVVLFGRHLVEMMLPGVDLIHDHGIVCEGKRHYVPMFHPVAALYNVDIRKAMFRDFSRLNIVL